MKSPCELVVWHLLPAIRSELVKSLKEEITSHWIPKPT
jgi:predicted transcriptional regulator